MNTYTDEQLKRVFPKLLPERVYYGGEMDQTEALRWRDRGYLRDNSVSNEALLQLCWEAEETLTGIQQESYRFHVNWHASWQKRIAYLAAVKGITL